MITEAQYQRGRAEIMAKMERTAPPGAMERYHTLLMHKDKIIQARQARQASRMYVGHGSRGLDSIRADLSAIETQIVLLETDVLLMRHGIRA